MSNENEAKVLREIADTLLAWREAVAAGHETNRPPNCLNGIRSLELLRDHENLVCRCAGDYVPKNAEAHQALTCLSEILPDIKSGNVTLWYYTYKVNVIAAPGFRGELKRWADELEKPPKYLITLRVAVAEYEVSRSTLMREINIEKTLKSYRPPDASKKAKHLVDSREVFRRWGRRKKS